MNLQNQMRTSSSSSSSSLCLTCYTPTSPSGHPPPFIYSCCQRRICPSCISIYARLVTYCPNCENAESALRKGKRSDVVSRGDVVFDLQKEVEAEQDRVISGETDRPPTYAAASFSIGDEENDNGVELAKHTKGEGKADKLSGESSATWSATSITSSNPTSSSSSTLYPDLLLSSRSKSIPTDPELDRINSSASTFNVNNDFTSPSSNDATFFGSSRVKVSKEDLEREKMESQEERRKKIERGRGAQSDRNGGEETRQYFLRREDNLQKISLLFNVSIHTLLQLNQLSTPSLLHTRSCILIPSSAVDACLEKAADSPHHSQLSQALSGPPRLSTQYKIKSARLATESKFRSSVSRNSHSTPHITGDEIPADERAARAYVALVEEELKWFDFGDEIHQDPSKLKEKPVDQPLTEEEEIETERLDLARMNRFDAILKQALARWEMDSEWERNQRVNGKNPESRIIGSGCHDGKTKGKGRGGFITSLMGKFSNDGAAVTSSASEQRLGNKA